MAFHYRPINHNKSGSLGILKQARESPKVKVFPELEIFHVLGLGR